MVSPAVGFTSGEEIIVGNIETFDFDLQMLLQHDGYFHSLPKCLDAEAYEKPLSLFIWLFIIDAEKAPVPIPGYVFGFHV